MKDLSALFLLSMLTASSFAQIPPAPGMPPVAQAQQAFQLVQAQSMMMTNQAQLQGLIASQASMMSSAMARTMFLSQAASLQVRVAANQSAILAAHASAVSSLQRSFAMQSQLQTQRAMLHAIAAQTSGQTASSQAAAQPSSPEADSIPAEAPPMMIRPTFGSSFSIEKPKFSVESGKIVAGTKVRIKCETHYATLYFTTNGWTPTTQSAKYTGPITIDYSTHLQVIAVGPNFLRSAVEHADYQVPNAVAPAPEATVLVREDGILRAGTPLRVAFAGKDINSETAEVGDEITLVLDQEIKLGTLVLARKGTPVNAVLTFADPGHGPAPGDLVFEVRSVEVAGKHVPLFGGETLEGVKGGKEAVIKVGMTAMAFVGADTSVK